MKLLTTVFVPIIISAVVLTSPAYSISLGGIADKAKDAAAVKTDKKPDETPAPTLAAYTGPKKRLAVMDMEVKISAVTNVQPTTGGGYTQTTSVYIPPPTDFGQGLTEMLTTALINSNRFIVLERKALSDIQSEQMLAQSGATDPSSSAEIGKLLGAQAMIRGAVTEYTYNSSSTGGSASILKGVGVGISKSEALVVLDIRIYDVNTGQILDSVKADGTAKSSAVALDIDKDDFRMSSDRFKQSPLGEATRQAIEKAVAFICKRMETMPWEGRIAELETEEDGSISAIYINAGIRAGIKVGDRFEICRAGRAITDPETKVVIGRTKDTLLGTCRIETVMNELSVAVPGDGEGYKIGDLVRLIDPARTKPATAPVNQ